MPLYDRLQPALDQPLHQVGAQDVLPEALVLQQLEVAQRRPRVREVLDVRRPGPVAEVGEVGDEGRLDEELLGREVVEVQRVRERLDELRGVAAGENGQSSRVVPPPEA